MAGMRAEGTVDARFEPVRTAFEQVVADSPGTGASLAVWHDGEWGVDLWGGWADAARTRPWRSDTLVMPYSVTKPFAAVCLLLLVERGLVDLDAPMTTYWPELPGSATVRQVLDHSAGHVLLDRPASVEAFYDWDTMCRLLEQQPPRWRAGERIGESALFYGHLLGEVVRRVDGRSLGSFLHEEVATRHGLDFHVGVHQDLPRVADLTGFESLPRYGSESLMDAALGNPPGALDPAVVNSEAWRRAEIPAVNGHGTARAVAGLYVALRLGRLLSPDLLHELVTPSSSGLDAVVGAPVTWGLGVSVDHDGWGMGGVGGSFGWWSETGGYAFAFLTGDLSDPTRGDRVERRPPRLSRSGTGLRRRGALSTPRASQPAVSSLTGVEVGVEVARPTVGVVVPVAAGQLVVVTSTLEGVVAPAAEQDVVVASAADHGRPRGHRDRVDTHSAAQVVVAALAEDGVVPTLPRAPRRPRRCR